MDDINPVEQPIVQPSAEATFHISPKTSFAGPAQQSGGLDLRQQVARDMMLNARELNPSVNWNEVFQHLKATRLGRNIVNGEAALLNSGLPQRMALIGRELGITMDEPRMVYLSVYHAVWSLLADIDTQNTRINSINSGERQFGTPEDRDRALQLATAEVKKLGLYVSEIERTLSIYTEKFFVSVPEQDLLKDLLYADPKIVHRVKRTLELLKDGKFDEALKVELKNKPDRQR
ncbi:MAG: hypothetical protein WC775_03415 [Patescibacteria group bacterium]|jgi:hypothetical protein